MKVIATNSFKQRYKKLVSLIDLKKLSNKLKEIRLITLKYPYLKLKLYIWWIAIRWVILKTRWWNLVYLLLCLKKDKNCWYNITFENLKKEISLMESKVISDIKKWLYEEY